MASSSPRFTRCNTVWRDTPSFMVVSSMGRYSGGACSTMRARSSSVMRICHGAPGSDLFTSDEAFGQPTMDRGSIHAQDLGSLADRYNFALRRLLRGPEARDAAIAAQTADLIGREAFPARSLAPLTIQDAGDNIVGIESGKTR